MELRHPPLITLVITSWLQEDRKVPDIVYSVILAVVLLLAIFTHLPSFCHTVRDWRRPSNVSLIYRNLLVADSLLMFVTIPLDIYWTLTRHDQAVCKLMKGNLFLVFFAACNLLIILAVDRYLFTGQWPGWHLLRCVATDK